MMMTTMVSQIAKTQHLPITTMMVLTIMKMTMTMAMVSTIQKKLQTEMITQIFMTMIMTA